MKENLADYYWNQLGETTSPGKVLHRFYNELLDVRPSVPRIIMLNKLIKMYGRHAVFFALLDLARHSDVDFSEDVFGLLNHYAQKRLTKKSSTRSYSVDRTEYIEAMRQEIEKRKNTKKDLPEEL